MFKFLSGIAVGWTAARLLPPRPAGTEPWYLPTESELRTLAMHASKAVDIIRDALDDKDGDQRADKTRFS